MGKYTPGPWAFEWENDNRTWAIVKSPTGKIVANVNTESGPDIAPLVSDKMPAQANAQLISAAPDLLAALKEALEALERADDYGVPRLGRVIDAADAAIRKGRGRVMTSVTRADIRTACAHVDAAVHQRRENQRRYMRGYYAETKSWCKERGLCQRCRKEQAEPGRSLCWSCRLHNNQRRSGAQTAPRRYAMACCDDWDYGEPDGECPDCGAPTVDGDAATGCRWSPVLCETCGSAPCDGSC